MHSEDSRAPGSCCPVCGSTDLHDLLELGTIPIFCNVQSATPEQARLAKTAPFRLLGCLACGHSFNGAFDPGLVQYAPSYDTSQHFSATFRDYAEALGTRLVDTYSLHEAAVVDVGCGKGDLLKLICRKGHNRGFGFDQSYDGEAQPADAPGVTFRTEFFDAGLAEEISPALICCRHVLEHVAEPVAFLEELAKAVAARPGATLYIEVPNGELQIRGRLIWDYIYEHYSYFSLASLRHALDAAGFEILRLETGFGDQFLCADVCLQTGRIQAPGPAQDPGLQQAMLVAADSFAELLGSWREWANRLSDDEGATVLWGAGSKGVTFLNLLGLSSPRPIHWIVDQNPNKQGRFVAGTGQEIVAPERLIGARVHSVVIMNDIYRDEISTRLAAQGTNARVISAMAAPPGA